MDKVLGLTVELGTEPYMISLMGAQTTGGWGGLGRTGGLLSPNALGARARQRELGTIKRRAAAKRARASRNKNRRLARA